MLYNNLTGYGHVVQLVGVSSVGDVANMLATCSLRGVRHLQVEGDCLTADSQCRPTAALNDRPIKYIVCLPLKDVI